MESNFLTAVFLPLSLFVIMFGMGLGLTLNDFKRVFIEPQAAIAGLIAQLVLLPLVGFVLATVFPLTPNLAVGVTILAACPGGPTSNLITYLVKGNVALSVTLTAISSLVTVFTIPLIVNFSMQNFIGEETALELPLVKTIIQIAVITLIPTGIGMLLHHYQPMFAAKAKKTVKWLSLFFLTLIIVGLLIKERANVIDFFYRVGGVMLTLNVVMMFIGYQIANITKLNRPSARAIAIEVGIQNGTLAIAIASSPTWLNTPTMAIPAAIYSLIMYPTSAVFARIVRQRQIVAE